MKILAIIVVSLLFSISLVAQPLMANNKVKNSSKVKFLTKETFKQKVYDYSKSKNWKFKGKVPSIIDFYADWCRPCKMLSPFIESASETYKGKLLVYKVNTDNEQELSQLFNITSIPDVLFIPANGQPQMNVGYMTKEELDKKIKDILKISK